MTSRIDADAIDASTSQETYVFKVNPKERFIAKAWSEILTFVGRSRKHIERVDVQHRFCAPDQNKYARFPLQDDI